MDGYLVTQKSKKQSTVAYSSLETEYRAMAYTVGKLVVENSLGLLPDPMEIFYDNQSTIYIADDLVFHEWTMHIEADYHFTYDAVLKKMVTSWSDCRYLN